MDEIQIEIYRTSEGKLPFVEWYDCLSLENQTIIDKRVARVRKGNFGDIKRIGGGKRLFEMRIHSGPGFRIYCMQKGNKVVILLCGGLKRSQKKDISKAKQYLQELEGR